MKDILAENILKFSTEFVVPSNTDKVAKSVFKIEKKDITISIDKEFKVSFELKVSENDIGEFKKIVFQYIT